MGLIPAKYIGDHEVLLDIGQLKAAGRPIVDGYGAPLQPTLKNAIDGLPVYGLRYGDTLMMPDYEVLGQTILHFKPPLPEQPSLIIGAGKVILKEHEGQSLDVLRLQGYDYEFQAGRSDFQALNLLSGTNNPDSAMDSPDASHEVVESPAQQQNTIDGNGDTEVQQ